MKIFLKTEKILKKLGIVKNKMGKTVAEIDLPQEIKVRVNNNVFHCKQFFDFNKVHAIYAGENVSYAVTDDGKLHGWGEVYY